MADDNDKPTDEVRAQALMVLDIAMSDTRQLIARRSRLHDVLADLRDTIDTTKDSVALDRIIALLGAEAAEEEASTEE